MSLLTDKELAQNPHHLSAPHSPTLFSRSYLLHSLRLSYLHLVLPSHAPQSSLPGTGPFNLLSFAHDPSLRNPYVLADGLADEAAWPELVAGRSSPPLGTGLGADLDGAVWNRRNRRTDGTGGGGLRYSTTIGGKIGGVGMRVTGREPRDGGSFRSRRLSASGDAVGGVVPPALVVHSPPRSPVGFASATRPSPPSTVPTPLVSPPDSPALR